jgi:hypothetical protein|tara:strand:+ start:190 stop:432 length:243 start_codon:yes stop_codon:yes gene_type:complete
MSYVLIAGKQIAKYTKIDNIGTYAMLCYAMLSRQQFTYSMTAIFSADLPTKISLAGCWSFAMAHISCTWVNMIIHMFKRV